jgi:hypothetical protein
MNWVILLQMYKMWEKVCRWIKLKFRVYKEVYVTVKWYVRKISYFVIYGGC